jgi:ubiquitin-protein ligase
MTKRLNKDLEAINKNYADQFTVAMPTQDIRMWHVEFQGAEGTIYAGEKYKLQFKFSPNYVEC